MKKLTLSALLLAGMMFMGASTANAEGMKCGAGKCGKSMKCGASTSKKMTANGCKCVDCDNDKCAAKLDSTKECDCNHDKKQTTMKCGTGKCGTK
jgi:hypothetical protein